MMMMKDESWKMKDEPIRMETKPAGFLPPAQVVGGVWTDAITGKLSRFHEY